MENIPEWLAEKISGIASDGGPQDRGRVYYAAAGWTIAWYLRLNIQSRDVDEFFDPPGDDDSDRDGRQWRAHANRAILVAETLFLLRSSPGFAELRERLEKRKLRPSFFEMLAAKQFFKAGFDVDARRSTGVLTQDFDFRASRHNQLVNVEVTMLDAVEFSVNTIRNALNRKRTQLPGDAPAVIYCGMPENWFPTRVDWEPLLRSVATDFLRGTRRINAVVFWAEQHIESEIEGEPVGALTLIRNPYFNPDPRFPTELSFLAGGVRSELARAAILTGSGLEQLEKDSYDSDFFRWIDSLVPSSRSST